MPHRGSERSKFKDKVSVERFETTTDDDDDDGDAAIISSAGHDQIGRASFGLLDNIMWCTVLLL